MFRKTLPQFTRLLQHTTFRFPSSTARMMPSFQASLPRSFSSFQEKTIADFKIEKSEVRFDHIGGYHDIKAGLAAIITYSQDKKNYPHKRPKNLLLYGPPGTGKSYFAQAVCGQAARKFILASQLTSVWVHSTEENLRKLFKIAKENDCDLIFDEFDTMASKRVDPRQASERSANGVVNELNVLLDQNPQVFVIATTNFFASLDPALSRRFTMIELPFPDEKDRLDILSLVTKNLTLSIDLVSINSLCVEFSSAKIVNLVNEAERLAKSEKAKALTFRHFELAFRLIEFGTQGRSHLSPSEKAFTSQHEAGHALAAYFLNIPFTYVTIRRYGSKEGHTQIIANSRTEQEISNEICVMLAGRAAEKLHGLSLVGSANDIQQAIKQANLLILNGMGSTLSGITIDADRENILQTQSARAYNLLKDNKDTLELITQALTIKETLTFQEFEKIVKRQPIHLEPEPEEKHTTHSFPKAKPYDIEKPTTATSQSLSITIDQIAEAFDIRKCYFDAIEELREGSFMIYFTPNFKLTCNKEQLQKLSLNLNVNNVNHELMMGNYPSILIHPRGVERLVSYVNKIIRQNIALSISTEELEKIFELKPGSIKSFSQNTRDDGYEIKFNKCMETFKDELAMEKTCERLFGDKVKYDINFITGTFATLDILSETAANFLEIVQNVIKKPGLRP